MEKTFKVLHMLNDGNVGGIEVLCLNAARYSKQDNTYLFLWMGGKISDEMIAEGYNVEVLNTSIPKYIKDSIKVAKKCHKENYDVIICHGTNPMVALCVFWIRLFNKHTPIIGYVHSAPDDWSIKTIISTRMIFRHAKKIICISDSVLNSVKKNLGYGDKLIRIYNGVDVSKFQKKREMTDKTGRRLIYVGRLIEEKGVQVILNALAQISTGWHFDIVGDGDYREQLENLTDRLGLNKKVTFHGTQSDIRSFLARADIFIHVPILEEGFGIAVVEAMAAGLLCICSKSGALPEIIEDKMNGYLVDKNSSDELAHVIQESINNYNSERNRRIRDAAIIKAKEYSIESYSVEIDNLVNDFSHRGG